MTPAQDLKRAPAERLMVRALERALVDAADALPVAARAT